MKTQAIVAWIIVLIILDQAIKILIFNFFGEIHFEIIPSLIEFKPTFNVKHSWVNTLLNKNFGINVGFLPHVILYFLIGILLPMYFSYFRHKVVNNKKLIDIATIFLMAAILCALIGNIIWKNGTLDFVYLKPLFVFDLKDVFSDFGVVVFLIYAIKNRDRLKGSVKFRDVYLNTKFRLKEMMNKTNASN